jgi:hypothetical protein
MVEHESNLITYYISQQIKRIYPSNSSHHLAKNTENMSLKLLKFVLNCMDLRQMLDTKNMRLVETFPMIYHSHCLNLSFKKCGKSFGARYSKNRVTQFKLIARVVQAHVSGQFNALFF